MGKKNPEDLGIPAAIICSLLGRPTDFYPRVKDGSETTTLPTEEVMKEFGIAAGGWDKLAGGPALTEAIGLARQSLNEVKAQTEYQDQKAGRLLTVATIFSALAALLFQRFNDAYPVLATWNSTDPAKWLIFVAYVPFLAFVLAVLFGALVTFHATRTRFKYKEADGQTRAEKVAGDASPKSRLFYTAILGSRPRAWADAFVEEQTTGEAKSLIVDPTLSQLYFRDLIGETYLIAAKTADKIRFLVEAQRLFAWALLFLLLWLFMFFLVSFVPSTKAASEATVVRLEQGTAGGRPSVVRLEQQKPLEVHARVDAAPRPTAPADAGQGNTQ